MLATEGNRQTRALEAIDFTRKTLVLILAFGLAEQRIAPRAPGKHLHYIIVRYKLMAFVGLHFSQRISRIRTYYQLLRGRETNSASARQKREGGKRTERKTKE